MSVDIDILNLPFITQEQKCVYWEVSKAEIKKLRLEKETLQKEAERYMCLITIGFLCTDGIVIATSANKEHLDGVLDSILRSREIIGE